MANKIQIKRGIRSNFNTLKNNSALSQGELYLITDEDRVVVGLGNASSQDLAKTSDIPTVNNATLTFGTAAASTGVAVGVSGSGFSANTSSNATYNVTIGPAISNLANTMTVAGTTGFLKKTAQDTYTLDTSTYVTTSTPITSLATPTAALNMNNQRITGLPSTPTDNNDAVSKLYVDGLIQGIDAKQSVKAATIAEITLSGEQTIDGVALVNNDRVLVKNQTNSTQNGIYIVSPTAWSRAPDTDTWNELISAFTFVEQGTTNADTSWLCPINAGGTLGSSNVTFNQFASAGSYLAGDGLVLNGSTFNVAGTADRITVSADSLDISLNYVGQSSITTLGTIVTGTWNATTIGTTKGGTGLTSYATGDIIYANADNSLTKLTKPATLDSFLQMTAAGVASWVSTIDGGIF